VTLDQPGAFYSRAPGSEPQLAKADARQIAEWARETEVAADGPAAAVGGSWRVVAAVLPTRDAALQLNRALRAAGYPAEVVLKDGYIAVQVPGLAGEAQARALMAKLRAIKGVEMPTVHPMGAANS
jgi:cell division septation protein DedD